MSDNKRTGRGVFGKGYYIALILCAAAIGITGYLYNRNASEAASQLQAEQAEATVPANLHLPEDVPAIATQPEGIGSIPQPTSAPTEPTKPTTARALKTAAPLSGQTLSDYSMEALSYNQTTRDWRVHNGVDIAAEEGSQVCAAADGEVYTVFEDDTLGHTVVIKHAGGYVTKYASLHEDLAVKPGDSVTMGQVIGTVGSTALVETTLGPHVHFSVTYQDNPMDPAQFLAMGN